MIDSNEISMKRINEMKYFIFTNSPVPESDILKKYGVDGVSLANQITIVFSDRFKKNGNDFFSIPPKDNFCKC